ncbi:MAG: Unknown protein [uncultured Sulfurovum sp.]|uniref:HD domain-containing protein n=1 Tax=uncultured Sulfurovum sp. TaxID=269237 RepID=A0A6S6U4X5_9BACT|nr:MAG: Unknown protein [uncultured Sulfurovum sp.]
MVELLHWFQTTYPELKHSLLQCNHNFDDNDTNPYHVEGDCWSHTMMVCKIAELYGYDSVVQVAALLHDIGKPPSRKINLDNNHVQFFGHEALSAKMAEPLVRDLVKENRLTSNEAVEVLDLIALHAYLYKEHDVNKIVEKFKGNVELFKHLVELNHCDDLGRFSKTMGTSTLDTDAILKQLSF